MVEENNFVFAVEHDGGNGFTKERVDGKRVIFPSLISKVRPGEEPTAISVDNIQDVKTVLNNYENNMFVSVQSPSLYGNSDRIFVGGLAASAGSKPFGFNVNSAEGKSQSDISLLCLFSSIAYRALSELFTKSGKVPTNIEVEIPKMTTALPINEFKRKGVKENFMSRFTKNDHVVIVNNFTEPVTVRIKFDQVDVQPEGVIGLFGLIGSVKEGKPVYRNDDIFSDFKKENNLDSFNGETVRVIGNVICIDAGDGTIDISVTNGNMPVPKVNSSINAGIGNVIEAANQALTEQYPQYSQMDRQSFLNIALHGSDKESKYFQSLMIDQMDMVQDAITEQIKSIFNRLHNQVGLIVICGGGASALKLSYAQELRKLINELSPLKDISIFGFLKSILNS